jgi:hypothetical protein
VNAYARQDPQNFAPSSAGEQVILYADFPIMAGRVGENSMIGTESMHFNRTIARMAVVRILYGTGELLLTPDSFSNSLYHSVLRMAR